MLRWCEGESPHSMRSMQHVKTQTFFLRIKTKNATYAMHPSSSPPSNYSSFSPAFLSSHFLSSPSTLFTSPPVPTSHSLHLLNTTSALLFFAHPLTILSNNPLTFSFSPWLISKLTYTSQMSHFFGHVVTRPSKMVRPRSGSPCLNSSAANFCVR